MRDFHTHWYQPQSITAVAVGNLPVDQLIQIVEESFADAIGNRQPTAGNHSPLALTPELPFQKITRRELTDPSLQQARLIMTWRVPGLNELQQTYALDVLASVLGHGRTSRLVQDLREQQGLVSSISASNMTYQHQGSFYISAHLPKENVEAVESAIAQHIRALQEDLIKASELSRVRTRVANHFIFGNETPGDRSGLYGYYQSLIGDLKPALNYPALIQSLDVEQLRSAAHQYLSPEAYGVVVVRPGK
jgi:predicted Zn-dependent peptidase